MGEVMYYWVKGRAWKCAEDGGFEVELVAIDQEWGILLMVTKEAAMSFSQFGYPYNATSQVSFFSISHKFVRAHQSTLWACCLLFNRFATRNINGSVICWGVFPRVVMVLSHRISIYSCPITLNYEWTHVFFLMTIGMDVTYRAPRGVIGLFCADSPTLKLNSNPSVTCETNGWISKTFKTPWQRLVCIF